MKKRLLALILALVCLVDAAPLSVLATEIGETEPVSEAVISEIAEEEVAAPSETSEEVTEPEATEIPETMGASEPAEEVTAPENSCGENLTWVLDENGILTVSGTGLMNEYDTADAYPWYAQADSIKSVVIEEGVLSIGSNAFAQCLNLATVTVEANGLAFGENAFADCAALKSVFFKGDAPAGVSETAFTNVSITAYYPAGNATWTEGALLNYGGTVSWVSYCPGGHNYVPVVTPATCTENGFTTHTCTNCGNAYTDTFVIAPGHSFVDGACTVCGMSLVAPALSVSNDAAGQVRLTWSAVDQAVSYKVFRANSPSGPFDQLTVSANTECVDTTAEVGRTYYYVVCAASADGTVSPYSAIKVGTRVPAAPVATATNISSSGKIRVSWEPVEGAVKYKIYRASAPSGPYTLKYTTSSTRYTNTGAEAGKTYYYYVVAVAETGMESAASQTVSRICKLPYPTVSVSNVPETGKVRLTWEPVEGAVSYKIYRSTTKDSGFKNVYNLTSTTYTHTSGEPGIRYYYKVVAVAENTAANSAKSSTISRICDCAKPVIDAFTNEKGKIRVTWEPVEGAVKYKVYRCDTPNGTYKLVYTTSGSGFTNSGAEIGSLYYYKVKAVPANSMGTSVYSTADYGRCVKNVYQYVYSSYSLYKSSTYARQTNLRLACKAINGTILAPGEEFSFNDIVGRRTEKKGYMVAGQVGGEGLGGGICQVSSVLFNAALLGNLKITKRWQHSVHPSYCPLGRDAMIYGTRNNLRFVNDSEYYIKIQAQASGGKVTIKFLTREAGVSPQSDVKLKVTKNGSMSYTLTRSFQGVVNYTAKSNYVG